MAYRLNDMNKLFVLVLLLTNCLLVSSQPAIWEEMKKKYPDESGIYLNRDKIITLQIIKDSLTATAEVKESILFLKDRPDDANDMRIFGSHFHEIEDVQANTLSWQKSKYKAIPLLGLTRKREDDSNVFYDDSYFYHFSFPAPHAGNQAVWQYTERYRDTRFLPTFYFHSYLPQAKGSFVIRAPQGVELKWHVLNDEKNIVQFKKYTKGVYTYYEWVVENIPAYKSEDSSPSLAYFLPVVVYHITSYVGESGAHNLLSNLNDLNSWYNTTLQSVVETPSKELTEIVNQLVLPDDTEMDIVKKVYYWVQDNIRYIAFEDGMRGLVPHKPSYVLEKRYGDCKDMASLIVGLLKAAGIKSYYTWIGTRDIPYQYSFIPSPLVDNHMIATYIDEEKNFYFLDGTSNYTPVPFPSSMIQGKEALIALGPDKYELMKVPEIKAEQNSRADSIKLTINDRAIDGWGRSYFTGYQKVYASYDFNKTIENTQKENVVSWIKKGSNKFLMNTYEIKNLGEKDLPLILDYTFQVSDYVTYSGPEIYVNLNLSKPYYNNIISSDRQAPLEIEYNFATSDFYSLDIPEGYDVEYLPQDASYESPMLSFSVSYTRSENSILFNRKLKRSNLLLTADQFDSWNKAVKSLSTAYKESIIFKRKNP